MSTKDDQFLEKLLSAFRIEAEEHIKIIDASLMEIEKAPENSDAVETTEIMYREAHSLKGAARAVGKSEIESICQVMESILSALKKKQLFYSIELFDALHKATDHVTELLTGGAEVEFQDTLNDLKRFESGTAKVTASYVQPPKETTKPGAPQNDEVGLIDLSLSIQSDNGPEAAPYKLAPKSVKPKTAKNVKDKFDNPNFRARGETVRIATQKLDPLLRQVEEMVSIKLTLSQRASDLTDIKSHVDQWKKKWTSLNGHNGTAKLDSVRTGPQNGKDPKFHEFMEWNHSWIESLQAKLRNLSKGTESDIRMHGTMVDELLEHMMNVLMLPCSSALEIFPKIVRDFARESGKKIKLELSGGELEVDRRILEGVKDPLVHMIRNSIDHGIESPEVRKALGKPEQGTIKIGFSQVSGNQIELIVSDDGAGIQTSRVKDAARRQGLLSGEESGSITDTEALALVFRSEVSTRSAVSDISGRGLGLAIVRDKIEDLGGSVSLSTTPNQGVRFRILLPVTLSTFRGILVSAQDQLFVAPTSNVERVLRVRKDVIATVGNKDTLEVEGKAICLVRLSEVLKLPKSAKKVEDATYIQVLILKYGANSMAFSVDAVLQEQEVLVKGLGKQLSRVRNIAGSTLLGSGRLALILNVPDLIKSASKESVFSAKQSISFEEAESMSKSILVVEDSITSRMLLKNILEGAGYQVATSVDGADAWEVLNKESFDLVVSDVEMPKLSGFDLAAKIRNDQKLSDLPIILVTSLGSREDKERGMDAGANAYIVKAGFDQTNLLDTISRFV